MRKGEMLRVQLSGSIGFRRTGHVCAARARKGCVPPQNADLSAKHTGRAELPIHATLMEF